MNVVYPIDPKLLVRSVVYEWRRPALEMDRLDGELRLAIRKFWPAQSKKLLHLLVPRKTGLSLPLLTSDNPLMEVMQCERSVCMSVCVCTWAG